MSQHPLDGPRHKLGRAEVQLDQLDAEIARFLRRDTYEITQDFKPDTGRCTLHFIVNTGRRSNGASIGEIVHNLRSALDHLACQLFRQAGGTDCDATKFPILVSDSERDRQVDRAVAPKVAGRSKSKTARASAIQTRGRASKDPLAILNRLANDDKHRLLVPIFAAIIPSSTAMIGYRETQDVDPSPQAEFFLPAGPLHEDAPLAELDFPITGPNPYVEVEPHFPIDIAFTDGAPVVTMLGFVGGHVATEVFRRFLPFSPRRVPKSNCPKSCHPPARLDSRDI